MKSSLRHTVARVLIVSVCSLGLQVPAHAGLVSPGAGADRERISAVLDREDVRARLAAQGVDPAQAKARVAALTDDEATRLAAQMDALPAGAGPEVIAMGLMVVVYGVAVVLAVIVSAVRALANSAATSRSEAPAPADAGNPAGPAGSNPAQ